MKLFYFKDPEGNFGDDINAWIWDALLPGFRGWRDDTTLIGIGTLLNIQLTLPAGRKLVVGTGTGYGTVPELTPPEDWDIRAVRGPRSTERLGIAPDKGIVDPAMMLPLLPDFADIAEDGDRPVFVPHCSNAARHPWAAVCSRAGIRFVSPRAEARGVIREIARAPLVVAESMHAAIVADAFRTPWIAVSVSSGLNLPKWQDWADSVAAPLTVQELFPEFPAAARAVRRLTGGRGGKTAPVPAVAGAAAPTPVTEDGLALPPPPPPELLQRRLRRQLERPLIAGRLARAAKAAPTLSDAAILQARQEAFAAMLDTIRRDYGTA